MQRKKPNPKKQQPAPAPVPVKEGNLIKELFSSEQTVAHFKGIVGPRYQAVIASILQIVDANKDLAYADAQSVLKAAEMSAILDLPLNNNMRYAHISAYPDEKTGVVYAQFNVDWRGLLQLGLRSGQFKTFNVSDVRSGELLNRDMLSGDCTFAREQDDEKREPLPVIGYVSYFRLLNGFEKSVYMTVKELDEHGLKYSKTFNKKGSGWEMERPAMYRKTVIKKLLNDYAPLTIDTMLPIAKAIQADQSVMLEDGKFEYPDNPTGNIGDAPKVDTKGRATQAAKAAEELLAQKGKKK